MTADVILERLLSLHPKKIDLSLDRMHAILKALGHPELSLPPVIHVAGTNGKGSTVAFLRAMAEAAGLSVHVYTSPHLVRFHERIRLNGQLIEDRALEALLAECEAANGGKPITFFEITTAAAFLAFSRHKADLLLLEVGLGGRLDATNVIAQPLASVIAPVSLDHQEFLGPDLASIAGEKAGIIKPKVPAFIGAQSPEAEAVIEATARRLKAPLFRAGQEWRADRLGEGWFYRDEEVSFHLPLPGLAGSHQIDNAALAVAVLRHLPLGISRTAMAEGLRATRWPARLQSVARPDLAAEFLIDGGHNPAAAEVIARALDSMPKRPTRLVMGMLSNRDPKAFLTPLRDCIDEVWTVAFPDHECHSPESIAETAQSLGLAAKAFPDVDAVLAALEAAPYPDRLLCGGSLYLAGTVLSKLGLYPE